MTAVPITEAKTLPPLLRQDPLLRIGLLALSTDLTIEGDAARLLPPDATQLHVTRVSFTNPTTPANLRAMAPRLAEAADLLVPGQPLAAICYGCTAASCVIGDAEIAATVNDVRPGVPVLTPTLAARQGFAALGVSKISLLTPYLAETTAPMIDYFEAHGITITSAHCMGFTDDTDMARIMPDAIVDAALKADHPEAEGMFLSCTALPALGLIEEIEAKLDKPVLSSNHALFWAALRVAGATPRHPIGRLFSVPDMKAAQ